MNRLRNHHSPRLAKLGAALGLTFLAAGAFAATPFQVGDILYTDSFGAVFKITPATLERSIVASGDKLVQPYGIALEANGDVLVSDTGASAIIRIDSQTGVQTVVASGPRLGFPLGIAVDRKGDILVANTQAILRLNPQGGQPINVSSRGRSGGLRGQPLAVAVAGNDDLIVATVGTPSEIVRLNPRNGAQTVLPQVDNPLLRFPRAIAVNGDDIYVTDLATSDGNFGEGRVIRIDLTTGAQTEVSHGENLIGPVGIAIDGNGRLVVGDPYTIAPEPDPVSGDIFRGGIIRVDPVGGGQSLIARGDGDFVNPRGIAIVRALRPGVR